MRKDDGGMGLVAVASATKDGRTGLWPPVVPYGMGDSGTTPSSAAVTVIAVEVVPTVGDGEGARGGTVPTGLSTCSFLSSGSGNDASTLLRSGGGERVSGSG